MSYIELPNGIPDFSKAVISVWFRVPSATIAAQYASQASSGPGSFFGVTIPIITFGRQQVQSADPSGAGVDPCYVGLTVHGDATAYLACRLQTAQHATAVGYLYAPGPDFASPPSDHPPAPPLVIDVTGTDLPKGPPEFFLVDTSFAFGSPTPPAVAPDQWHHVLISFDVSGGCATHGNPIQFDFSSSDSISVAAGTTAYSRFWYAIDDVNYDGAPNLEPFSIDSGAAPDPNAILTQNGYNIAGIGTGQALYSYEWPVVADGPSGYVQATYSLSSASIPSFDAKIGIPASASYTSSIYRVELAELQMWTGLTLDTSVTSNRRGFIDGDGKPVSPDKKASPTDPQSGSIELLGRSPDVLLHKSGNWKNGRNTGSTGVGSDGSVIPDGQFNHIGKIDSYKPDPSLHGPQNPGEKK